MFDVLIPFLIVQFPYGSYSFLFKDIVSAVDLCHRDGTLKQMVAQDPKRYSVEFYFL